MRIATIMLALISLQVPNSLFAEESFAADIQRSSISVDIVFSSNEVRIIRAHYESQGGNSHKGNGKQKHKGLPPGIAKNLARGKSLPPGIAKRFLPYDLVRALPPVQEGYERIVVDGKILLIEIATQVVADILSDILLN